MRKSLFKRRMLPALAIAAIIGFCHGHMARISAQEADQAPKAEFVGSDTCMSCHSGHENFKDGVHGKGLTKAKGIAFDRACETCHGPGSLHTEAAGDKSQPGFNTVKVFKTMPAAQVSASCMECHQGKHLMHWEGGAHANRNVSCVACHSVHNPKAAKKLLNQTSEAATCYTCHQNVRSEMRRFGHMPVMEGKMTCSNCHNAHGNLNPRQIVAPTVNQLCYNCHSEKRGPFLWEHAPVREQCTNCHHPHGSRNDNMLIVRQHLLCQRCHVSVQHPSTLYGSGETSTQQDRITEQSCQNCHSNIHGSNHPSGKYFVR